MATINISSITQYYNSNKVVKTGTSTGTGSTKVAAQNNAKSNAQSAATNAGVNGGTPPDGGSSSTTALFGSTYGSKATSTGTPTTGLLDVSSYKSSCSWTATRTSTMYQVKLKFTLPSGLTVANVAGATLAFTGTSSVGNAKTFRVCAPTTTEQTGFQKYSTATSFSRSVGVNFNSAASTTASSYSFSITDVFKQCITNSQGWITLLIPIDTVEEDYPTITITGTPTITYTESYSSCTAPTSVTAGAAIQKLGGTVAISWSGASGGTNNAITGYRVYYQTGSVPTTSTTTYADVSSSSYSFTIPSGATRGATYYFKVVTKGAAGSGWYSGISSAYATVKVNSLPNAPTVSASPTRIKSTGSTTVTFTVTAGATNDTGQTASLYYATSATGAKEPFTSPLKKDLSATTTYYFWTSDGLEFSSAASASIIKNTPPTIGSITMSAYNNVTYTPSVRDGYVKNINGSATNVTGTNKSYQWKLLIGSGSSATSTNISTSASFTNVDVTAYGVTFNSTYQLALVVTDDLGESATAYSTTVYGIPAAPTISIINNKSDTNWDSSHNVNPSHFENGIRVKYNPNNNNGINKRVLEYSTASNFSSYSTINLNGISYDDVNLSSLTRGATYYFRVRYTCNSTTAVSNVSSGYMRANDIAPNISAITQQSGSEIKPYTQDYLNFTFTNSPISWAAAQDVATSYGSIYSTKFKFKLQNGTIKSLDVTSSDTGHANGTVTGTVTLSSISTASWKTLFAIDNAPNATYTITLEITATNGFGQPFIGTKDFKVNFIEGFVANQGNLQLSIETGSGFTNISGYSSSNRYSLFPTQTIRFAVTDLQCYADQNFTIEARDTNSSGTLLGYVNGTASDWELLSGSSRIYKLKYAKLIEYFILSITQTTDKTFCMKIILSNGQTKTDLTSSICKYRRIQTSSISPKINFVTESQSSNNNFTFTYQITDYGGDNIVETGFSAASKQGGYSAITGQFFKCSSAGGTYSAVGSSTIDLKGKNAENQSYSVVDTNDPLSNDIIYFGIKLTLTVAFVKIGGLTPTGTTTYPLEIYKNLYTYYRETPNLLYGKNFFCLNQNAPIEGRSDQLLEISTARYTNGNTQTDRDTIYFGTDGTNFKITGNGLVIDCGSW